MNLPDKYILIVASQFNTSSNVGNYRINRFIRWFNSIGIKTVVISYGKKQIYEFPWGINIQLPDKTLELLNVILKYGEKFYPIKLVYIFLKAFLKIVLIPDEERLWVNTIVRNQDMINYAKNAILILSSSPMESSHVATFLLNAKTSVPFIADLRDGWLDEPLKLDFILKIKPRTKLEKKLEKKIYEKASRILVTSENWRKELLKRYPEFAEKTFVLTNAYPINFEINKDNSENKKTTIIYAGKFRSSRKTRKIDFFLDVLNNFEDIDVSIKIIGLLKKDEKTKLNIFKSKSKLDLQHLNHKPLSELRRDLETASGFLLLTVSMNVLPVKLFEYILTKKPVLAITPKHSAVWEIVKDIPQFFIYELNGDKNQNKQAINQFLHACKTNQYNIDVPHIFNDEQLKSIFFEKILKNNFEF